MRITDIRTTKRGRISVYVDEEFTCVLHPDVAAASGLAVGSEITSHRLEELGALSMQKIAKERALGLLSARSYTAKGLRDKLAAHTDEESAQLAVERMEELGLVDDADYARRFAADCVNIKGYSLRRTAQVLREKGVDRQIVEETLADMDVDPEPAIARIVLRKHPRFLEDEKAYTKTINALARLGYDYGNIRRVLRNLAEDMEYYKND